ncbi:MAG: helix-turn-helix transcriptional regulator [Cyclobacteriaceae bacterium]|nr:helix-turn-helix transcriptional regulator [Cyclobacteriaceae bacterium]UYN85210.1 MAG: helix-turn-helix transcriptional regulator [Cyclobacteriaceae bacterium]
MKRVINIMQGGVQYLIGEPTVPLNLWVDHFLIAKGWPQFSERRVFPNNHVDIFFNLGDSNNGKLFRNPNSFEFKDCIVSGLRTSFMEIRPSSYFEVVGIRFTLFGFFDLFKIPAVEITDQNYTQFDVLGKEAQILYAKLMDCKSIPDKFNVLEQWMQAKADSRPPDIRNWARIEQILREPFGSVQTKLAQVMGYSHKHIVSLFRERAGLTPKAVQKIYRMNSVIKNLSTKNALDLPDLAYALGYSDQSHMIREVKRFTGFTPVQLQHQHTISTDKLLREVR